MCSLIPSSRLLVKNTLSPFPSVQAALSAKLRTPREPPHPTRHGRRRAETTQQRLGRRQQGPEAQEGPLHPSLGRVARPRSTRLPPRRAPFPTAAAPAARRSFSPHRAYRPPGAPSLTRPRRPIVRHSAELRAQARAGRQTRDRRRVRQGRHRRGVRGVRRRRRIRRAPPAALLQRPPPPVLRRDEHGRQLQGRRQNREGRRPSQGRGPPRARERHLQQDGRARRPANRDDLHRPRAHRGCERRTPKGAGRRQEAHRREAHAQAPNVRARAARVLHEGRHRGRAGGGGRDCQRGHRDIGG